MRPDLRSMSTLRLSAPAARPMTMSALARSRIGPSDRPAHLGLGDRVPGVAKRREALDELGDPSGARPRRSASSPAESAATHSPTSCVLVGEPGQRVVDEVGRRRLAAPVEVAARSPCATPCRRRSPASRRTATGRRKWVSQASTSATLNLLTANVSSPSRSRQLGERVGGVSPQLGDEVAVEHDRVVVGAPERIERALLGRCEPGGVSGERTIGGHATDRTQGVSQRRGPRVRPRTPSS